jgi:hypothetical protein
MKLSSFLYLIVLVSGLLIPAQQSHAFFFDFDFSSNSDYYGWNSPYHYSRYQPYYWNNRNSYYRNRYNPYWNHWGQPYRNDWGQPCLNQYEYSYDGQQSYGSVADSDPGSNDTKTNK